MCPRRGGARRPGVARSPSRPGPPVHPCRALTRPAAPADGRCPVTSSSWSPTRSRPRWRRGGRRCDRRAPAASAPPRRRHGLFVHPESPPHACGTRSHRAFGSRSGGGEAVGGGAGLDDAMLPSRRPALLPPGSPHQYGAWASRGVLRFASGPGARAVLRLGVSEGGRGPGCAARGRLRRGTAGCVAARCRARVEHRGEPGHRAGHPRQGPRVWASMLPFGAATCCSVRLRVVVPARGPGPAGRAGPGRGGSRV